mgnify:CR=1 FL=1
MKKRKNTKNLSKYENCRFFFVRIYTNLLKNVVFDIIKIINNDKIETNDFFNKYGIDVNNKSILIKNDRDYRKFLAINLSFLIITVVILLIIYIRYNYKKEKDIKDIIKCIEQINKKNYEIQIDSISEDELSILKNEIYKTTIMLKEAAENSSKDKLNLKKSLEDISHQLKTPLTSIRIMLDNIQDDPDMEKEVREDFLIEISKQIDWISSLVVALLKIAKFDAGTIKMENNEINAKNLIDNIVSNLAILMELKNIEIITNVDEKATFIADYKWQQEALTNILKNAIEHSKHNSRIYITVENTNLFLKIIIKDEGSGIDKEDLKHIFQRFYKTKNSSENSIGIGLPLAKAIIEQSNGYIKVETKYGEGTSFEVKYIK